MTWLSTGKTKRVRRTSSRFLMSTQYNYVIHAVPPANGNSFPGCRSPRVTSLTAAAACSMQHAAAMRIDVDPSTLDQAFTFLPALTDSSLIATKATRKLVSVLCTVSLRATLAGCRMNPSPRGRTSSNRAGLRIPSWMPS